MNWFRQVTRKWLHLENSTSTCSASAKLHHHSSSVITIVTYVTRAELDRPESGNALLPPLSEEQCNCKHLHDGLLHNRRLEEEEEEVDISPTLYRQCCINPPASI